MKLVVLVGVFFFVQAVVGDDVSNCCGGIQYKVEIFLFLKAGYRKYVWHFGKNKNLLSLIVFV